MIRVFEFVNPESWETTFPQGVYRCGEHVYVRRDPEDKPCSGCEFLRPASDADIERSYWKWSGDEEQKPAEPALLWGDL